MSENLSKSKNEKLFSMKKRDGSKAEFRFIKQDGIWYWDIPHKQLKIKKRPGTVPSLPLPDVNLDKCDTLKDCFDAISKQRGTKWVGEIYADIMAS